MKLIDKSVTKKIMFKKKKARKVMVSKKTYCGTNEKRRTSDGGGSISPPKGLVYHQVLMEKSQEMNGIHNSLIDGDVTKNDELFHSSKKKNIAVALALQKGMFAFGETFKNGKNAAMHFFTCDLEKLVKITSSKHRTDIMTHEILLDDRLMKLVLDIEVHKSWYNSDLDFRRSIHFLIEELIVFFHAHDMKEIKKESFVVMMATRKDKFSSHIIIVKNYVFSNVKVLTIFVKRFIIWTINREIKALGKNVHIIPDNDEEDIKMISENTKKKKKKRVSILFRKKFPFKKRVEQSPFSTVSSSSGEENDDESGKILGQVFVFDTMIDIDPLTHRDGTLRLLYSTKPGHQSDESYRLWPIKNVDELLLSDDEFKIDTSTIDKDMIRRCLSQGVRSIVDGEKTNIISTSGRPKIDFENEIKKKLSKFSYLYYESNRNDTTHISDEKEKQISFQELSKLIRGDRQVRKLMRKLSGFTEGQSITQNMLFNGCDEEDACLHELRRNDKRWEKLYKHIEKMMDHYTLQYHVKKLMKERKQIVIKTLKISKSRKYLSIITKNGYCEIVWTLCHRKHMTDDSGASVFYKIKLDQCVCYQKCKKSTCQKTRGEFYRIGHNSKKNIQNETINNDVLQSWLENK